MAFTQEDRNVLIATQTRVENVMERLDNLPCEQHPPDCTQETRLKSLETTRSRAITGTVTTVIGMVVAFFGYLFHRFGG